MFVALAIRKFIEAETGWSIKRFVKTARRYRTIQIQAGEHTITAADPLPGDLAEALCNANRPAHKPQKVRRLAVPHFSD